PGRSRVASTNSRSSASVAWSEKSWVYERDTGGLLLSVGVLDRLVTEVVEVPVPARDRRPGRTVGIAGGAVADLRRGREAGAAHPGQVRRLAAQRNIRVPDHRAGLANLGATAQRGQRARVLQRFIAGAGERVGLLEPLSVVKTSTSGGGHGAP